MEGRERRAPNNFSAACVCRRKTKELGIRIGCLSRGRKWEFCRAYFGKRSGKGLHVFAQKACQGLPLHGTVDDFFRRPNEERRPETMRGKNKHFSRNCYNVAALQDRIPGLGCIGLGKERRAWYRDRLAVAREKVGTLPRAL